MSASIIFVIVAFALGYAVVPSATKELLIFKYKQINKDWASNLKDYANHVRFVRRKPALDGERVEKGMAQWGARQVALVNGNKLSYEKVAALRRTGVIGHSAREPDEALALPREREVEQTYHLHCTIGMRLVCGLCLASVAALLAMGGANPIACISGLAAGAAMVSTYLCDMRARIIPWQLCYGFGFASLIFAASSGGGIEGVGISVACAAGMYLALCLANQMMQFLHGSPAIGDGDLRFIPMICIFSGLSGTIWGFMGASVVMALIALATVLFKGGNLRSYIPYAPGLGCWYAIGLMTRIVAP